MHGVSGYRPLDLEKMGWAFAADFTVHAIIVGPTRSAKTIYNTSGPKKAAGSPKRHRGRVN